MKKLLIITIFLSALIAGIEQSRAEQSRAEQSRAEQSRAEQSRAESFLKNRFHLTSIILDSDITKQSIQDRILDIAEPNVNNDSDIFFFLIHGGGWSGGKRSDYYPVMQYLTNIGYCTANAGYRHATAYKKNPKKPITVLEQLEDIRESYILFIEYIRTTHGIETPKIVVMGSSAGAHLAALLAYTAPGQCGECAKGGDSWIQPIALIAVCAPKTMTPWKNIGSMIWNSMQNAVGVEYSTETHEKFKMTSPGNYITQYSCPTFIICAEKENLFPNKYAIEWIDELKSLGVYSQVKIYINQYHGFLYYCANPQQREAMTDIVEFINSIP